MKSKTFVLEKKETGLIELRSGDFPFHDKKDIVCKFRFRSDNIKFAKGEEFDKELNSLKEGDRIELKIISKPSLKGVRKRK